MWFISLIYTGLVKCNIYTICRDIYFYTTYLYFIKHIVVGTPPPFVERGQKNFSKYFNVKFPFEFTAECINK